MHKTSRTDNENLLEISQYTTMLVIVLLLIIGLALAIDPITERVCLLLALLFTLVERYIALKKYRLLISRYIDETENRNELLL